MCKSFACFPGEEGLAFLVQYLLCKQSECNCSMTYLQAALANSESRISALIERDKALQEGAEEQEAREGRLMEEANMLRRAVQVFVFCPLLNYC